MTGATAGPVVAGLVARGLGLVGLFWLAAALLVAGSAASLLVTSNRRVAESRNG